MIKSTGNSLVLFLAMTSVFVVVAGYFVLNYKQSFPRYANTAIDAAALTAAKDLSYLVIDEMDGCHFGVIGLVDDTPRKKDQRSVYSVHTVKSAIERNMSVARKISNQDMLRQAQQDLKNLETDSILLRRKIASALVVGKFEDKDGNVITLLDDVNKSFDRHAISIRSGKRSGLLQLVSGESNYSVQVRASQANAGSAPLTVSASAKIGPEPAPNRDNLISCPYSFRPRP